MQCKIQKILINFNDIDLIHVQRKYFSMLRFSRNNLNYLLIINVCKLFKYGLISNMNDDENYFSNFILEEQMQKIYEKFLLNFYKIHPEKLIYKVHAPSIQ